MQVPRELNFIKQGEIWAIVGTSGSGHVDFVKSISGKKVEHVTLRHQFKNLSNTTDFYYQQRYNSIDSEDSLTVKEYLEGINSEYAGFWTLDKIVCTLYLERLLDEQVIKLSNGETRRVLIASALIKNPEVITFDHPLTGLDAATRNEFSLLLEKVKTAGALVVIATNPDEIPDAISHIAVMREGNFIFQNTKEHFNPSEFEFDKTIQIDNDELWHLISLADPHIFEVIISMKDVTVEYDGRKILDDINWTVKQGERWALTGPNGAGKSTLLSLVNADNPQAYANDIILFDRRRGTGESIWDIKKQTGFISPELYQYFPTDSSCLHVIESGFYDTIGLFRPADATREDICRSWMKLMFIEKYANKLFSHVPPDVQRLCLLARAVVKNPALLILDEPTQGLDTSQQQFFTHLVDEICSQSNVTLVYVSHYETHIPNAVSKRIRLDNGKRVY